MRLTVAVLSSAALAVMCQICQSGQPALAQEQRSPLSGKISTFGAPAHTRLSREELSPFAAGGSELPGLHTLRALEPHGLLNGNVDSQSAQLLRGFGRMDRQMDRPPPFMGRAQNFNLGAQMQRHPGFAP